MSTTAVALWVCARLLIPDPKCVDQPDCMSNLQTHCGQKCRRDETPVFKLSPLPLDGYDCRRLLGFDAPRVEDSGIHDVNWSVLRP